MSEVRSRGRIFAISLYFFVSVAYIFFGVINEAFSAWHLLGAFIICVLGAVVLFITMPNKDKPYIYYTIWAVLMIIQASFSGVVFNNSRIALGIFMVQWIIAVNFLSEKFLKLLLAIQCVSLVAYNIVVAVLGSTRLDIASITIEGLSIIITFWISLGMVKNFILVYEEVDEQRLSLNEFLKLLKEKNAQAQSATKSKSIFLSNMSHEIRTPINSILGMNELILRESREKAVLEKAGIIKSSSELLLSLVNDILDFSKIESGKMELVVAEYNSLSLINDIYNIFAIRMSDKKLEFRMDVDEKLPAILMGDSMRLRQVIINLMTNALKYTDEGSVTFRIYGTKGYDEEHIRVNVEVIDTGIGIAKEDLSKLNESFVRLNLSHNNTVEGTGLGINIVNGYLALMDSSLMVESQVGAGSKFSFTVEQKIVDSEPVGVFNPDMINASQHVASGGKTKFTAPDAKFLVVDDNEANIKVFTGLLSYLKVNIDAAFSGESAIKLCDENKYDIIFMDHMMPVMNGIEAFHRLHEQGRLNQDTPVYILTANAVSGAKEEYLKEGFHGYLSKPIIPDKLEKAIYDTLDSALLVEAGEAEMVPETDMSEVGWDVSELPQIEGVDWEYAKLHFDKKELLIDILRTFVMGIPGAVKQLTEYLEGLRVNTEAECIDEYRILVHSMKSSANMCGIIPLGGMAATLEYAARDSHVDTLLDMTPHYLAECEKYCKLFNEAFGFNIVGGDEVIDSEEIKSILTELIKMTEELDVDGIDKCMESLTRFHFEGELRESVMNLGQLVATLETDKINHVVEQILNLV